MKHILTIALSFLFGLCFGQKNPNSSSFETLCDSIYNNKGFKIIQTYFPEGFDTGSNNNMLFQLLKTTNSNQIIIYQDTIYSRTGEIEFRDFNNDGIKDILIQNISDVRSNRTYYLYLADTLNDGLKKIEGFEEIKNPNYLPEYNLIDNYVNSGRNWTSFYKIQDGAVKDYNIVIYDAQTNGKKSNYFQAHKKAIQKILKTEKKTANPVNEYQNKPQ